jgi:hypothetical protein
MMASAHTSPCGLGMESGQTEGEALHVDGQSGHQHEHKYAHPLNHTLLGWHDPTNLNKQSQSK